MLSSLACYLEDDTDWHNEADTKCNINSKMQICKFTEENYEVNTLRTCRSVCKDFGREYFTWDDEKGECWCNTGIKERRNIKGFYSGKTVMEGKRLSEIPCKFYIYCH